MMARTAVYAGSFDPVTIGHEDIIRRAAKLCDRLLVTVMHNPNKRGCFSVEERLQFLRRVTADIANVEVDAWDGLLVDYVKEKDADFIIRGIRGILDLESEMNQADVNRLLLPGIETVFLATKPELACVSSSVVREGALFQADISSFVPESVLEEVEIGFKNRR